MLQCCSTTTHSGGRSQIHKYSDTKVCRLAGYCVAIQSRLLHAAAAAAATGEFLISSPTGCNAKIKSQCMPKSDLEEAINAHA